MNGTERCERRAAWLFDRCSKQSRQLATRAISANSQSDFHQHVITQTVRALKVFDSLARPSDDVEVVRGCMISKEPFRQISNIYIALRYAPEPAGVARDKFAKEARAFAVRR
jgi:hypothetical protein